MADKRIYACLALLLLVTPSRLVAEPESGKFQPNRLDFGTVQTGATVEGSVRIFEGGNDTAGISFSVKPPPFVLTKNVELGTQTYGRLGTKVVFDISFGVATSRLGEHSGLVAVQIGSKVLEVPIRVNVVQRDPAAKSVLIVETPFDKYSTDDASLFDPWLELVESAKLDAHYLDVTGGRPVLRDRDLSDFDVILLGETGLVQLRGSDVSALDQFVEEGGRLIVTANRFYVGTVDVANELLALGGLLMADIEAPIDKTVDLAGDDIADHPLTKAVRILRCHRPSPIVVTDDAKGKILISAPPFPGFGFVAVGQHGRGQIIGLGQSLWWNWVGSDRNKDVDNGLLLRNLIVEPVRDK